MLFPEDSSFSCLAALPRPTLLLLLRFKKILHLSQIAMPGTKICTHLNQSLNTALLQGSAKRWATGCVNGDGKDRQK